MIEVQIRRSCSQPPLVVEHIGLIYRCPECGAYVPAGMKFSHDPILEWMPFEKAFQMAHEESAIEKCRAAFKSQEEVIEGYPSKDKMR